MLQDNFHALSRDLFIFNPSVHGISYTIVISYQRNEGYFYPCTVRHGSHWVLMTAEHLQGGWSKLTCAVSGKYISDFENLV